jgi:hypothetical protein
MAPLPPRHAGAPLAPSPLPTLSSCTSHSASTHSADANRRRVVESSSDTSRHAHTSTHAAHARIHTTSGTIGGGAAGSFFVVGGGCGGTAAATCSSMMYNDMSSSGMSQ